MSRAFLEKRFKRIVDALSPGGGWTETITHGGTRDGFAIQFLASGAASDIAPGSSFSFSFTSADSPASVNGDSVFQPDTPVDTSFVHDQGPFMGASEQIVVTVAPTRKAAPSLDFVIGSDNQVYTRPLDASGNPTGGYYQVAFGQVKDLAAIRLSGAANFEAFVIGTDNQVYASTISGSTHSGYAATARGSVASITVGTDAQGHPLLFAIGTDNKIYGHTFDTSGNSTGSFYATAAGTASSIDAGVGSGGDPDLFAVLSKDSQVYTEPFDPAGKSTGMFTLTMARAVKKVVAA